MKAIVNTNGFMFLRYPPEGPKKFWNLSWICQEHRHGKRPREEPPAPVQPEPPHSQHAPAQPHLSEAKGAAHVVFTSCVAPVDLFIRLHTKGAGLCLEFCLFSIFVGQQILLQVPERATAERVTEWQCRLRGQAEESRAPAVARIFNLAFHSVLTALVFL